MAQPISPWDVHPDDGVLSALFGRWVECGSCRRVSSLGSSESPWRCPACGALTEIPAGFFRSPTLLLLDLIQQTRWSKPVATIFTARHAQEVGIVLFYCALQEALLEQLLRALMRHKGFPEQSRRLLFDRHQGFRERLKLFGSLAGKALDRAARELDAARYEPLLSISKQAVKARNRFLHKGEDWDQPMARECVDSIPALLRLFVGLHNEFVAGPAPVTT